MASRYSAARPKRDGENFARTHHNEDDSDPKRVKFDVRNPSKLAPEAREDDAVLDADVIGASGATKRGAVNLDGYDSDSDNDDYNTRANTRRTENVNILEQLDNYDSKISNVGGQAEEGDGSDVGDMFAADEDDEQKPALPKDDDNGKNRKKVQFMDAEEIAGQETQSKTGGTVRLDDHNDESDDEEDAELAAQEEGVDEEVGAGGLKRNAPKLEAFNLRQEMEEGRFDQDGNYVLRAGDPDAVHDNWLDGTSKKDIKKAAEAHERREAEARKQRIEEDEVLVADLLKALIVNLEKAETPLEALQRLGKGQAKTKKIPQWKLKKLKEKNKNKDEGGMDVDQAAAEEDPEQVRIKATIAAITEAADKLLSRDHEDIYHQERGLLIREYRRETGEEWVEPERKATDGDEAVVTAETTTATTSSSSSSSSQMWEFRWIDGRDGAEKQGPFDRPTMKAWQDAGYFGEGVEFRPVEEGKEWTRTASFA